MLGLVNRPNDISLSRTNQSQAKFKSAVGGNLLQSWVNLTIADRQIGKKANRQTDRQAIRQKEEIKNKMRRR